jgi:hypothetical protein
MRVSLHPGQARAWESQKRFITILAGTQGGKTSYLPLWLHREMNIRGPGDYLASSATFPLLQLKFLPEMIRYFCSWLQWGTYQAGNSVIVSNSGCCEAEKTRIIIRSGSDPDNLESATIKGAILDEFGQSSVPLESWEAVQRRASIYQARICLGTTPYNLGWLKQQLYDRWVGGDPDYDVIQFSSIMNPMFPKDEYERMRRTLPTWKFRMFYDGEFTRPAGLIYGDYDESIHCIRPLTIPKSWPRHVGIDFGAVNTALLWIAERPMSAIEEVWPGNPGDYYVYRERHGGGLTAREYAREALDYHENVVTWRGGARSEDAQRLDWSLAGVPVEKPEIADLESGIDRGISLFREKRLYVMEHCNKLRSELGTYSRELDGAGEPTEQIENKASFHLLDCLRYGVSNLSVDSLPAYEAPPSPFSFAWAEARRKRRRW